MRRQSAGLMLIGFDLPGLVKQRVRQKVMQTSDKLAPIRMSV